MRLAQLKIFILLAVLAFADAGAKTVSWSIAPKYDKCYRYHADIFLFQQNGKWGMVKPGNMEILPASVEYVSPFINGYAIAMVKEGGRYVVKNIISESGEVTVPSEKYYVRHFYFSEGKLAVSDRNGKYGYIDPNGRQVIRCRFDNALPFKEGWAPVKMGDYVKFINGNYDRNQSRNVLTVDFHYGEMTAASCFRNGQAAVAYNSDYALIGRNGKKIRGLSESYFKSIYKQNNASPDSDDDSFTSANIYTEYSQNGLWGLKQGSEDIAKPQFDAFTGKYTDGHIEACMNSRCGVLTVLDGDCSLVMTSASGSRDRLKVDRKGVAEKVKISGTIPSINRRPSIQVDCGDGQMRDMSSQVSVSGNNVSVEVSPVVAKKAKQCEIKAMVGIDGILWADVSTRFDVSYQAPAPVPTPVPFQPSQPSAVSLRISKPMAESTTADENDDVRIFANIYNKSDKTVRVTAMLIVDGKTTTREYSISAQSTVKISGTVKVKKKRTVQASISLSTGQRASNSILCEPYF